MYQIKKNTCIYIINLYKKKEIEKMWCCLISSYATLFYPLQKTY